MKFYPKLNHYKASNLVYDLNSNTAWSYEWYQLAGHYNDIMVLNTYNYSPTTLRHVYKLRKFFDKLGISYVEIEAPKGLQLLSMAVPYYESLITKLNKELESKRIKYRTERLDEIAFYQDKINFVKRLEATQ